MKLDGKPFYCPNSGVCTCAATGKKKPNKECVKIQKNKEARNG